NVSPLLLATIALPLIWISGNTRRLLEGKVSLDIGSLEQVVQHITKPTTAFIILIIFNQYAPKNET
ncbi:MAG: hypothetical protein RL642_516, partial [Bacteroidota bacterium]